MTRCIWKRNDCTLIEKFYFTFSLYQINTSFCITKSCHGRIKQIFRNFLNICNASLTIWQHFCFIFLIYYIEMRYSWPVITNISLRYKALSQFKNYQLKSKCLKLFAPIEEEERHCIYKRTHVPLYFEIHI